MHEQSNMCSVVMFASKPALYEYQRTEPYYMVVNRPGPEVIKLFSFELSTKFIQLINVKMQTLVGILKFISMINTTFMI